MTERDTEIEFDFFEEPATREAVETERAARRTRGPRRPQGPPSGLTPLLRLIGLISFAILVVVLLVFWISSCRGEAKQDRYAGYMQDVGVIGDRSERIGSQLATTLTRPEVRQAALVRTLDGYAQQHEQLVAAAEELDPPGPLRAQHGHLIDSLQFRVSGLRGLADAFGTRTGNATRVGELIGAQYRRLTASDVTWDDLFSAPATAELRQQDLRGINVPDSNFVANPDLGTSRALTNIWQRVRGQTATGGTAARPGTHGHNLISTTVVGGARLNPNALNKIVATTDLSFQVAFENSGRLDRDRCRGGAHDPEGDGAADPDAARRPDRAGRGDHGHVQERRPGAVRPADDPSGQHQAGAERAERRQQLLRVPGHLLVPRRLAELRPEGLVTSCY